MAVTSMPPQSRLQPLGTPVDLWGIHDIPWRRFGNSLITEILPNHSELFHYWPTTTHFTATRGLANNLVQRCTTLLGCIIWHVYLRISHGNHATPDATSPFWGTPQITTSYIQAVHGNKWAPQNGPRCHTPRPSGPQIYHMAKMGLWLTHDSAWLTHD